MCRESYEAVTRVTGSYEDFRQGVELLLAHRVPFVVKGVLLPQNKADVKAFEAWAARLPGMDNPPHYAMFYEFRGRRDFPAKNRLIESLRPPPHESATFFRRQGEVYLKEMRDFCKKFIGPPGDRLFACGAGRVPCVDAYGRLQACLSLRHPDTSYDLQSGSLQDALTMFFPRLREIKASNPEYLARCAHCFLKGLCEQCPAKSWTEHGTLDTPVDYLCRVAHAQARDLGLLKDAEQGWEVPNWRERIQWP